MFAATFVIKLINIVIGAIEVIIGLRIVLKALAASPQAPFVAWVYEASQALIWPFAGMFQSSALSSGAIIDFNALIGLVIYAFLGYLLMEAINIISYQASKYNGRKSE